MRIFRSLVLITLTLLLTGCALTREWDQQSQAKVGEGQALLFDDFSSENKQWDTWSLEVGSANVTDGQLLLLQKQGGLDLWSLNYATYWNTVTAVDARVMSGPENNTFGIVCRYQDPQNFYQFVISEDGYSGIIKVQDAEYINLSDEQGLHHSEVIRGEGAVNLVRADCIDDQLRLVVNHQLLAEARDADFTEGRVGVIAGTSDTGTLVVSFDNFTIVKP